MDISFFKEHKEPMMINISERLIDEDKLWAEEFRERWNDMLTKVKPYIDGLGHEVYLCGVNRNNKKIATSSPVGIEPDFCSVQPCDKDDDIWMTSCGGKMILLKNMKYCPFCGKKIYKEHRYRRKKGMRI